MAELADAIDLGSISKEWGFESLYPHQESPTRTVKVLVGLFILGPKIIKKTESNRERFDSVFL